MGKRDAEVVEVTEIPEFKIVDGRLRVQVVSGDQHRVYSISLNKALHAICTVTKVLDRHAQKRTVVPFPSAKRPGRH